MAYLGRRGALAPVNSADIPDNSITSAKIVAGTIEASDVAADMATQAELDLKAPITNAALVTPNLGTPSAGVVTNLSGVLPVGVTGGSGLTALGTVTAGNLSNSAIVYPAGHIIKVTTHVSANALSTSAAGLVAEADANDVHVTCVAGNKLNITIMGGSCLSLGTTQGWYSIGMRIVDSGTTDVHISSLYNRSADDYKNDGMPCMMYTHTAATTSVTIKRFIEAHTAFDAAWYFNETSGARYLIMEEQV